MNTQFWMIEGIGLNAEELRSYINIEKAANIIHEQLPRDSEELAEMIAANDFSSFDIDDYCYGNGFDSLADIFCHCDDTDSITWAGDGEGSSYFYYPPSMPWHHTETEPKSEEEVILRIIKAVQKITDMSAVQIRELIDTELHVLGSG